MLNAEFRKTDGVILKASTGAQFTTLVTDRLAISYGTCLDAWYDMLYWTALLYGDWYGNHGGNTLMYFFWQYAQVRAPQWATLCIKNNLPWNIVV